MAHVNACALQAEGSRFEPATVHHEIYGFVYIPAAPCCNILTIRVVGVLMIAIERFDSRGECNDRQNYLRSW